MANLLSPKSALRKMFEQHEALAAIACYPEEGYALETFISEFMDQEGLAIDQQAIQFLCDSLAGDRQLIRRELEKLALYCLAKHTTPNQVSEMDAVECIGDSSELSLDNLVYSVGDGNQASIDKMLEKAFSEGVNPVTVIRFIQRHFQRLHFIHSQITKGESIEQALGKLRPPIFFKHKARFRKQLLNWPPAKLNRALILAINNEIDSKTTGLPADIICNRTLMRIAQAANRN